MSEWILLALAIGAICLVLRLTRESTANSERCTTPPPEPPVMDEPFNDGLNPVIDPLPPPVDETIFDQVEEEILDEVMEEIIEEVIAEPHSATPEPVVERQPDPPAAEVSESTDFGFDSDDGDSDD